MRKLKITDAHVHFWDPDLFRYPWLDENPFLKKPFLPAQFLNDCSDIDVGNIVFVQAECDMRQYLNEVDWVTQLSLSEPKIKAIVAWAPLEKGENARAGLEVLRENKLVKGVRRIIQFEKDIEFCIQPEFIKGVNLLHKFNFSFDICITHTQLSNTIKFVKQCPDISFVLDHIGKPDIRNKISEPWKTEIKRLSQMQNINCKISGLVNEAMHNKWTEEDLEPYIHHIIECFGFDRIMYGSDWPVMLLASQDYPKWFNALRNILKESFSDEDQQKLFSRNAERIYRLT